MMRNLSVLLSAMLGIMACDAARTVPADTPPAPVETVRQALQAPTFFVGSYAAILVPKQMKKDDLRPLLPPWLDFGPTVLTNNGDKHPVMFHHQHYLSIGVAPGTPNPREWEELNPPYIVDLKIKDGWTLSCAQPVDLDGPFAFIPVSFANDTQAVVLGSFLFGLNMHLSTITASYATFPSTYDAVSLDPLAPITYHADFGALEALTPTGQANFNDWLASMNAPVLGKNFAGQPVWHQTDWMPGTPMDLRSLTTAHIEASSPQLGMSFTHDQVGINTERLGAFRIQSAFESTNAVACTITGP